MNDRNSISLNAALDEEPQGVSILVVRVVHNFVLVFDKYIVEAEEKEPAEQISSADTSLLAPYVIVSSTNSKAQGPNLNKAREAFPIHPLSSCPGN